MTHFIDAYVEAVRATLGPDDLRRSGALLYSASDTLRPGELLLLGTNPGGGDEGKKTIGEFLTLLHRSTANEYYDETFDSPSGLQLQSTIKAILALVAPGRERKVCATNVILFRSRTGQHMRDSGESLWELSERCWPITDTVFSIVKPALTITFGVGGDSAYHYLWNKLKMSRTGDQIVQPSGHGSANCKSFTVQLRGKTMQIAGLPHPSQYHLLDKARPMQLNENVRKFLINQAAVSKHLVASHA